MELAQQGSGVKFEDFLGEDRSVIIDRVDLHTVLEGFEVELLEQSSLGSFDFFAFSADLEIFGDFNLTLDDLGGDAEGVEEVNLGGVQASGTSGDGEIDGGEGTDSGFSGDFVGFDLALEVIDGGVGEDEGDLLFHEGDESIELGNLTAKLLLKMLELFVLNALSSHSDDFLDEGLDRR